MASRTIAAVGLSLALAAPAFAAGGRNQADELPSKEQQMAYGQSKSATSLAEQRHRQEVQQLLNKLEAGQKVDPAEVERVLRDSLQE